jgi:phage tail tube protein FII
MAYTQKTNPFFKTPCGRRRTGGIGRGAFKLDPTKLSQPKGTAENLKNPKFGVKDVDFPPGGPVTNMTVPFGGGNLGKAIKLGKAVKKAFTKKVDKKSLNKISGELKKASKLHAGQADKIDKMTSALPKKIKRTKISGPCKSAAKRKFKVWPSAYASGWGVRCTRAGGPSKMGKSKK